MQNSGRALPSRFQSPGMDWLEYVARQVADQQLHVVVRFQGQADVERMERVVRLTLDAEPVLGCRFVVDPRGPYWERRSDLDTLSLCHVIETQEAEASAWEWMATPLGPDDPVVQARIFRSDCDTLVVKIDHVAADAGGTKE